MFTPRAASSHPLLNLTMGLPQISFAVVVLQAALKFSAWIHG